MASWFATCAVAAGVLALGSPSSGQSLQPAGWNADVALREAVDTNPDPSIVEITLTARVATVEVASGVRVEAWTYDGGLPGPLIRARVGDRLVVHFHNALPKPTTVHWHGMRVPIQMDGVPDVSQPEVAPGSSFTYDFRVTDAGLFWYHPHVMSAAQVGFGLYGAVLVDDPSERTRVPVSDELVAVLSDIGIGANGKPADPDSGGSTGMAFGREGDHVLFNGRKNPRLAMRAGVPQRWRIVNAAKSRYFELDLDGTPFLVIGQDGGLQESAETRHTLVIAPGERIDAIVTPRGEPGQEIQALTLLPDRGYGSVSMRSPSDVLRIAVTGPPVPIVQPAIQLPGVAALDLSGATRRTTRFTIDKSADGEFTYGIDGVPFGRTTHLEAAPGETVIWTIVNETPWSHPFHLHGFFFQRLDAAGRPAHPLVWKDSIDVPYKQSVQVAVRFDDREGSWMYHCHILDHADGGLMGFIQVGQPSASEHRGLPHR